jgi:hypothetical protein
MQRSKAIAAGVALASVAGAVLYRRVGFRARERAELRFDDGSVTVLEGSPDVDEVATHAREALAAARG